MTVNILIQYAKALVAFVMFFFTKKEKDNIWVFGGINGELYTDNSQAFYEYILKNHPEISAYWIARKNSPAYIQAKGIVIEKGSVKNYLMVYRSRVTIFSDTFNSDISPALYIMPIVRYFYKKNFQVRLNHGLIAFKKMPRSGVFLQKIRDRILLRIDLNTASTELEVKVMSSYMRKGTVVLTGSARNDKVEREYRDVSTIFIAPTWRSWLKNKSSIMDTDFFISYSKLLSNPKLLSVLKEHNMKIHFFLHHLILKFRDEFMPLNNDVVKILPTNTELLPEILGSSLMITDYSSICAERFMINRPIIFFQFDKDRYKKEMGSYIDLDNDVFGEVDTNTDSLVEKIIASVEHNFPVSKKQIEGEKYFVHFRDKSNCDRIYKEIMDRI